MMLIDCSATCGFVGKAGRRAQYPITGLEWNAWYEGELRRIHADGQAYQRSVAETHTAAARLPRDGRLP
jgi:hypothetical protein